MTITRYVTADGVGVLSLVARAVDPNGSPITQNFTITANPLPESQKCYSAILALGAVRGDIASACAQFGIFNTYYVGSAGTIYKTDSCSEIIGDGFYKTEDGNWVNIGGGGKIQQRGTCATVGTKTMSGVPPIPLSFDGQTMEIGTPIAAFTDPAPSLVQPPNIVQQDNSSERVKPTITGVGGRIKEVPSRDGAKLIKQAQSLGLNVSSERAIDILRGRGLAKFFLAKRVQEELDKREKAARATTTTQTFTGTTPPPTDTE